MVESSAINKSLFVLAQCVEAISKSHSRIPYRESKMTRILSLGQNNGLTIMILNLAPTRAYHLDTLSSLNFANRTKKIEVNEIENEPIFRGPPVKPAGALSALGEPVRNRQPLRLLVAAQNIPTAENNAKRKAIVKTISVYQDKLRPVAKPTLTKRPLESTGFAATNRAKKAHRIIGDSSHGAMSKEDIEALIERRLDQKLAERALNEKVAPAPELPFDIKKRLDSLEERVSKKEGSEGLQYLLMAKQHQARGEEASALKMYQLAQPFFPGNEKLSLKIQTLQAKTSRPHHHHLTEQDVSVHTSDRHDDDDDEYQFHDEQEAAEESFAYTKSKRKAAAAGSTTLKTKMAIYREDAPATPRTQQLLRIINTKDVTQIKLLRGVGAKRAENIVNSLLEMEEAAGEEDSHLLITDLEQLGGLKGVGWKTLETMKAGLVGGGGWDF
jgi:DNA uptake protein ComE-like DNA-binding protein